jgi:hypothetical protein
MGGRTMSDFAKQTLTNDISANGLNAINALDPMIQTERAINKVADREIFDESTQNKQSVALNTVGKIIASWYLGGVAGDAATGAGAGSTVSGAATGAAAGGSNAAFNNQDIAQGAMYGGLVGGLGGAMAPETSSLSTTGGDTVINSTASATPAATETMQAIGKEVITGAGQGAVASLATGGNAGEGAAQGAIGGLVGGVVGAGYDQAVTSKSAVSGAAKGALKEAAKTKARGGDVNAAVLTGMANAGVGSALSTISSPTLQSAFGSAIMAGIGANLAEANGNETENAVYGGATSGLLGGVAYEAAGGGDAGNIAATVGQGAGTNLAIQTMPNAPEIPVDPQFEAYMKDLQRGYSPQITNDINPFLLASLTLGTDNRGVL